MSEEFNEENVTMADLEDHFGDANPWNVVQSYLEKGTVLPVKIEGIVNGGAIAMVEGIRGFIPASRLSLSYIEDLESYLLKDIEVQVIDVDQANNRLVLSARELLKEKEKKEREEKIANIKVGSVLTGTVESLQNYGAFVRLEDGLSGLVHVSQISQKRIQSVHEVLKEGDILISLTGNVGRVSLCKNGNYLLNQRVGLLQLAKNVNQEFLYQILSSQRFENSMIACGQGAAQMNIGKGDVENYVLPYSSNGNNILFAAKILHSYDECIINELRRLTLLTMQKQYLLTQMFI